MNLPQTRRQTWLVLSAFTLMMQGVHATEIDLDELTIEQLLQVNVVSSADFEQRSRNAPYALQVIHGDVIHLHGWPAQTQELPTLPRPYSNNLANATQQAVPLLLAEELQLIGPYTYGGYASPYVVSSPLVSDLNPAFPPLPYQGWQVQFQLHTQFNQQIKHPPTAKRPLPAVRQSGHKVRPQVSYAF